MNSADVFKKALDEAFGQGMTIDEAVAFAESRLEDARKTQTKNRWPIMIGITVAITLVCVILVFLLSQFVPFLGQWVTGEAPPSPTLPGQETPSTAQDISITVYDNNRQPVSEVEFVTQQTYTLTVVARSSDSNLLSVADGTIVTFQWLDCANISFSNNLVEMVNGEATTHFTPTIAGDCKLQVSFGSDGSSDAIKPEVFDIKIVSATSSQLSIRAEIRDAATVVESVEAGKQYVLKVYVVNNGNGEAKGAVVTITLPDNVSASDSSEKQIKLTPIDIPAGLEIERNVSFTVPYIQDAVEKEITIVYVVEYGGQTQSISFIARNPQPGDIVFSSDTVTITQKVTSITVTATDFSEPPQPIQYPVLLTVKVDPPGAGAGTVVTTNNGQATIEFTALDITATQVTLTVQSGTQLVRHLPLEFSPMVVGVGSGNAESSLYHRLTNDLRSQIVILPERSVELGADEGSPDLGNGRIVYQLADGAPVRVLGESRVIEDDGEDKVFYRVAVQFWIPKRATFQTEQYLGSDLPSGYLRIAQGEEGTNDDSWAIWTNPEIPTESAPTSPILNNLQANATDVDAPDNVIVQIIDSTSSSEWVLVEAEGWLAEDVIGFAVETSFQNVNVASTNPVGFVQTLIMPLANKGGRAAQFIPV